jgi:sugar fermentation stimulation protein A
MSSRTRQRTVTTVPAVSLHGPLHRARFFERPNRFLVRCTLEPEGTEISAHLPDPGRLTELLVPGRHLWLRHENERVRDGKRKPERKTEWTAVLAEVLGGGLVSLDTALPNRLIRAALEQGAIEELAGWRLERAEAAIGESRIDFLLRRGRKQHLALEVKSVTLVRDGVGLFPDAVTDRGARHVRELARLVRRPHWWAAVLFVVQRPDARRVLAAREIDLDFAEALAEAKEAGVRILGRRCRVRRDRVLLGRSLPAG